MAKYFKLLKPNPITIRTPSRASQILKLCLCLSLAGAIFASLLADSLTIIAVGDIMMGSDFPKTYLPPDHGQDLFTEVAPILSTADLTLGNLEGTFLVGGHCNKKVKKGQVYAFRTPPDYVQNLAAAGFDFINLANNHAFDFGQEGIASTIKTLSDAHIQYGGPNGKIGKFEIGINKIALICFSTTSTTNSILDIKNAQRLVAACHRENNLVIVSFHGGREGINALHTLDTQEYFFGKPRGNVVRFAHAVIDSGADFVWGHGPHVPRALEIYKDRLIAYSLGNFYTWGFNIAGARGYAPILKIVLDSTGIFKHGALISAIQRPPEFLKLDPAANAAKLVGKLSAQDFPKSAPQITDLGLILPDNKN